MVAKVAIERLTSLMIIFYIEIVKDNLVNNSNVLFEDWC